MGATNAELLRVIDENPDDVGSWMAYADWLMEHDAPRGELIALDIALETATDSRDELGARRKELVERRAPVLLGEMFAKLVAEGYARIKWRRGFVDEVRYDGKGLPHQRAVGWLVKVMCEQHAEPFTFLRELHLGHTDLANVEPLARFAHLVELDISETRVANVAPLGTLTRLRVVHTDGCPIPDAVLAAFRKRYSKPGR